ncbi:baseplate J/gp47 family protein [Paenibacillus sp. MWE-103]|uniref:Baseplate J/gp47 family protein n=1 Tax=Paenibacillus artemisiicola TaxID=1172618 RepID=A0ABS3WGC5_9BACL|nr:baseplate J/gp47 family protein [Paenibacillus artemisiicola]MBO7747345.1 baseplate J/gp47 family protein [Paenibacillus artemisiicola]
MAEPSDSLLQRLLDAVGDSYDKTPGYLVYDLLSSVAIQLGELEQRQRDSALLLDVDNLIGDLLAAFVFQRKGITRTPSTFAIGIVQAAGNGTVSIGDLFETKSGIQFAATATVAVVGTGAVPVRCAAAGAIGNVPANQITQMPVTLTGITGVNNSAPTHDGFEAESDESLRERYYIAMQMPVTSGNVFHYLQWAKEISGVGDVDVYPLARGVNTVEVVIIDQNKQPASETLIAQVQAYIDPNSEGLGNGQAPIGAHCYVISAEGLPVNITVQVQKEPGYTDADVIQHMQSSVGSYLKSIALKADYVSYAKVGEAVLNSEGVEDYAGLQLNGGTTNIAIPGKHVAIVGGVILA